MRCVLSTALALAGCLGSDRVFYEPDVDAELAQARCAIEALSGDADLAAAVTDVRVLASEDYLWHGRYEPGGKGTIYLDADEPSLFHELYAHRLSDLADGDLNGRHGWCWEQLERVLAEAACTSQENRP